MPQPDVSSAQGRTPLDRHLACHQWLTLGVGVDPASELSERDLSVLDALSARFICLNGKAMSARTMSLQCDDPSFADWAKRHRVGGVLVRPDRFIAERLSANGDLQVLAPFAPAGAPAQMRIEVLQH